MVHGFMGILMTGNRDTNASTGNRGWGTISYSSLNATKSGRLRYQRTFST